MLDTLKTCDNGTESCSTAEFQKYFQQWQHHWAKCISAQGEYIEGDASQYVYVYIDACNKTISGISQSHFVNNNDLQRNPQNFCK